MNKRKKFGKLYDENVEKIYRFVSLKVSGEETARDIVSETFKKGWEAFKKNPKMKNPRAYLYRIARNLVIDHYRTKKEHLSPEDVVLEDEKDDPKEVAELNLEMENIKKALKNLKDEYQNVVIWRYMEEMEVSEIADLMDKSENSVRVQIHRAITALEKELSQES